MKKSFWKYHTLLSVFFLILFSDNINYLIKIINKNFDFTNIDEYLNQNLLEENKELRKYLDIKESQYPNNIITKVKYNNIYEFKNELIVYKGSKDNIKKGQLIVNDKGLVGVISKVNKETSKAKLITNKESKISVKINNSYGILEFKNNQLIVNNLESNANIHINDNIYTSGITNIPGNIYIGKVKQIKKSKLNLEQIAIVEMAVNLNELSYVVII